MGVITEFRRKTSPRPFDLAQDRPFDLAQDSPRRLFAHRQRSWWGKRGGGQPALSLPKGRLFVQVPLLGIIEIVPASWIT